ncbi:DUF3850 domain-containing protein [Lactococcus garvieae]|uniref:DUF3850 domain-containing protein n=1 Tax=Lactococcus garvieae TaxID=1363 RepID=UPI003982CBAC
MKTHELKLDIKYFDEVKSGKKNFEIRKNDRDFKVGDILVLKAFNEGFYAQKGSSWHTMGSDCCFYTEEQADTIKVKVVSVLKPRTVNAKKYYGRGWKAEDSSVYISNFTVIDVLKEYFHTNHLPNDHVVLGIEVVE